MINAETKTTHDVRKKEIEAEIQFLSSAQLSESMSAKAVESFQKKQFELEKLQAILRISNETETPIQDVERFSRLAHSTLHILLACGEKERAITVITALQKLLT